MNSELETAQPENLVDLLNRLVPPTEPAPVSLFPETNGWYVVALVLLVGICGLVWALVKRHLANAYRREAVAALSLAGRDPEGIAKVIRQTALVAFPRDEVAGLFGDDWLAFLDRTCGGRPFENAAGRELVQGPYDPSVTVTDALVDAARHWVLHHQREPVS